MSLAPRRRAAADRGGEERARLLVGYRGTRGVVLIGAAALAVLVLSAARGAVTEADAHEPPNPVAECLLEETGDCLDALLEG